MRRQHTGLALVVPADRAKRSAGIANLVFEVGDARADGGVRVVGIGTSTVVVERRIAGIAMRVAVAIASYRGVALAVSRDASVSLSLVHNDRDLDIHLYDAPDDIDVTAEWQIWSARFGLPMLVQEQDGTLTSPFDTLGPLLVGATMPRRKGSILSGRRPRFLARRSVGRPAKEAVIYKGREIIAPY